MILIAEVISKGPRVALVVITLFWVAGFNVAKAAWNSGRAGEGTVHRSFNSFASSSGIALAKA